MSTTAPPRPTPAADQPEAPRPVRRPRRPTPNPLPALRAAGLVLGSASLACLAFAAFLVLVSPVQQSRAQDLLYADLREQLAAATAPIGVDPITPGAPIAILDVPALDLRQVVVEGTAGRDLRDGPGHVRTTTLPGQVGTSSIYGRSTTYGAPFGDLTALSPGDQIGVVTGQGRFDYEVEQVRTEGDLLPEPLDETGSRLVLVTTTGDPLRPGETVYVDALMTSDAAPSPAAVRPPFLPPYEYPLASDSSALLPLSLWILGLVGLVAGITWGLLRWGRWQTWTVAAPLVLAIWWGASDSAALLLPNLM